MERGGLQSSPDITPDSITALAPDAKVATAGKKLGAPKSWQNLGRGPEALWGECRGSAVYQVRADLSDLALKCSCPSRKQPCKHAIGLLFLALDTPLPEQPPPDWVTDWLSRRRTAAEKREKKSAGEEKPSDPKSGAKAAARREKRVSDGLDALEVWMEALPPLARVARYGNVRGTETVQVTPVIDALFERVLVGLPGACASLDEDAAREMAGSIGSVAECVGLLDSPEIREEWRATLRPLAESGSAHAIVRGWCCRLLLEDGAMDGEELQRLARLALSPAVPAPEAAAWVQGALRGSGLILLHQDGLWRALDLWIRGLDPETFTAMLPLVRRAFSGFEPPERRAMGEKVKNLQGGEPADAALETNGTDHRRAALTLPVLAQILGVDHDG